MSLVHPPSVYLVCVWCSSVACHSRFQRFGSWVLKETLGGMTGVTPYWCQLPTGDRWWWWHWLRRYQAQAALHRASLAPRCLVLEFPGVQPHIYLVLSTLRAHPTTGGRWRMKQSWRVHRSPLQSRCSTKHWPRLTATFFVRSRSV
jgi:hypothetical protein